VRMLFDWIPWMRSKGFPIEPSNGSHLRGAIVSTLSRQFIPSARRLPSGAEAPVLLFFADAAPHD
jgi:hypothetical protein